MLTFFILSIVIVFICYLLAKQASMTIWLINYTIVALLIWQYAAPNLLSKIMLGLIFCSLLITTIKPIRRYLLTRPILKIIQRHLPVMSATEREALAAGTVSWEGDILSGAPDIDYLRQLPQVLLTEEEQAFLDGPVNVLCRMLDEWDITHNRTDLPAEVWAFIKEHRFLGMIIPKHYGGLEFSATAQMSVLVKLYSRSVSAATTVSVPNSLGPAELLLKYGTDEQKNYYLPRLATGEEIPCFALTTPNAGSDAASITDQGIVCRQMHNGQEVIGIRLNWNKRYITLCPVATILGLAFRLFDPENILGKGENVGISCALIPVQTPGVVTGRRHFPLNTGFMNGPTQGKNVFVPLDSLIGGVAMAGMGWRMLMECLSAGRAISLPSSALGGVQAVAMASGAYARVRRQFNQPIGKFEGVEEPLARIAGNAYIIDAAVTMTAAAIDHGQKPAVAGAILKYHTTERSRQAACDAMDIHGGKGICLGPNNYLGRGYQNVPISITVEGANILSRSLIIFGQGAIRCHPYVFQELESVRKHDLRTFDHAFWGHVSFVLSNAVRSIGLAWTDGRFASVPEGYNHRYYQLLQRYSNHLAFLADFAMITLGGQLKRKEKLSARLGDMLSNLYLLSAVLLRFQHDKEPLADRPLVDWCSQQLLHDCETAMYGLLANFPNRGMRLWLRLTVLPWGLRRQQPSDQLGQQLAKILLTPGEARSRLTRLVFHEAISNCPLGQLETTFQQICLLEEQEKTVLRAVKEGRCHSLTFLEQIEEVLHLGLLSPEEANQLTQAELARQKAIAVDDFSDDELRRATTVNDANIKRDHEAMLQE